MSRFPAITESELAAKGLPNIDPLVKQHVALCSPKLQFKDSHGAFLGPYALLYSTPDLIQPWFAFAAAIFQQPDISVRDRELAVLAVCAAYDSPFVLYAHSEAAIAASLTEEQVQNAVDGIVPSGLSEEEIQVYKVSLKLASFRAPLQPEVWEEAEPVLGRVKIARLAHIVTVYIHASMMCNVGDGVVPEPQEGIFKAKKGVNVV